MKKYGVIINEIKIEVSCRLDLIDLVENLLEYEIYSISNEKKTQLKTSFVVFSEEFYSESSSKDSLC